MFPSPSDRRSWLPVSLVGGILLATAVLSGAAPWLAENIAPGLNRALGAVTALFFISLGVTLALLLPFWLLRLLIGRLMGVEIR
jgi:hypothetical protein